MVARAEQNAESVSRHNRGAPERRRAEDPGQQLDHRREDEHLGQKRHRHRQRQQTAEPGGWLVLGEKQDAVAAAVDDRRRQRRPAFVRGRHLDGAIGRLTGGDLPPIAIDEVDGVVVHDAERDARDHDGGDVHGDPEVAHHAEHGEDRQRVGNDRQQAEPERSKDNEDDPENRHERGAEAAHLRFDQVVIERAEQPAGARRQHSDAGAFERLFGQPLSASRRTQARRRSSWPAA